MPVEKLMLKAVGPGIKEAHDLWYIPESTKRQLVLMTMLEIQANTVLLDIDGVSCPDSFVQEVLAKFVRENTRSYLEKCWDEAATIAACDLIAKELGFESCYDWLMGIEKKSEMIDKVMVGLNRLLDTNQNSAGLNELHLCLIDEAYSSGSLLSRVFEDLPHGLASWKAAGHTMVVFSSKSATAQREFFAHTEFGDLSDYFAGYFDTSGGSKTCKSSYDKISKILNVKPEEMVLLSTSPDELDAAKEAGLQTVLVVRSSGTGQENCGHKSVASLYDLKIVKHLTVSAET